ncbi:putative T-complex protein 1, beta subunit [Trypanosoma cruzi]|uniref:Putative T-complex protein 1, beta subunit n=1 Tax=Trypanosoma cruzi TaxID=5693 RepID=A0A2V2XN82_TRYCR|nr:putative T-complex protein 1, beta subunit [Trypanosoma cruzi]
MCYLCKNLFSATPSPFRVLTFLAKMKIMVVKTLSATTLTSSRRRSGASLWRTLENLKPEKFGHADLVMEENTPSGKIIRVTGVQTPTNTIGRQLFGKTVTFFLRGSNSMILEEGERALHDSLCVIRSIVKRRAIIPGGAAGETEVCLQLGKYRA